MEEAPLPTQVPPSSPPRAWLDEHGITPGCYACDGILNRGSAKGRVHNKECKARYRKWLEEESERRRVRKRARQEEPEQAMAPPPVAQPAVPVQIPSQPSRPASQREGEDVPMEDAERDESPTNLVWPKLSSRPTRRRWYSRKPIKCVWTSSCFARQCTRWKCTNGCRGFTWRTSTTVSAHLTSAVMKMI